MLNNTFEDVTEEEIAQERARIAPVWPKEEVGYCTNVHPGESLQQVMDNLQNYAAKVRQLRKLPEMEVGLWLSQQAVTELKEPGRLSELQSLLKENALLVRSLNGFPFGGFHQAQQQSVKTRVYEPDWSNPKRLDYSIELVDVLLAIMPDDAEFAAISTLPLGYKSSDKWQLGDWQRPEWRLCFAAFEKLTNHCHEVYEKTGKRIVFAIEMEPDCALEFTPEVLQFFKQLRKEVRRHQYLTVCLDTCHQAVNFESLSDSITQLLEADIEIGKVQLSNALKFDWRNVRAVDHLQSGFANELNQSPWLHQTRIKNYGEPLNHIADFKRLSEPEQFSSLRIEKHDPSPHTYTISRDPAEARVHCHVPLFVTDVALSESLKTQTTQEELLSAIAQLCLYYFDKQQKPVVEVETYSWSLLQGKLSQDLCEGIVDELKWACAKIAMHKLNKLQELRSAD